MTTKELPRYKSHKIVRALKIRTVVLGDSSAIIVPEDDQFEQFPVDREYVDKHNPQSGGYFVLYEDGYKSWSPAHAFENGYSKIDDEQTPLSELKSAIHSDSDYAWTWLCNLACIGTGAGADHESSNRYAAQFMKNAFDIDVTTLDQWKSLERQWKEAANEIK